VLKQHVVEWTKSTLFSTPCYTVNLNRQGLPSTGDAGEIFPVLGNRAIARFLR
jgi:hypothetical protein